jgi:hypothetical protein
MLKAFDWKKKAVHTYIGKRKSSRGKYFSRIPLNRIRVFPTIGQLELKILGHSRFNLLANIVD